MKRKPNDEAKGARSKASHQANGVASPDVAKLIQERNSLRKQVAELQREKKMLVAGLASYMFKPVKINKRELIKQVKDRPTMGELIAELKKLGS